MRAALAVWGAPDVAGYDAGLLVTELATNAVQHTSSRVITVAVAYARGQITIGVTDQGPRRRQHTLRPRGIDATYGRGLPIVAMLADRCGAYRSGAGTHVWARIVVRAEAEQ